MVSGWGMDFFFFFNLWPNSKGSHACQKKVEMCAGVEGKVDDEVSKSDGMCCASSLVPLKISEGGNVKNSFSGLLATRLAGRGAVWSALMNGPWSEWALWGMKKRVPPQRVHQGVEQHGATVGHAQTVRAGRTSQLSVWSDLINCSSYTAKLVNPLFKILRCPCLMDTHPPITTCTFQQLHSETLRTKPVCHWMLVMMEPD